MLCNEVQQRLSSYYDHELPAGTGQAVARHVARCPDCGALLAAFERLSRLVRSGSTPPAPKMWGELERRLEAESRGSGSASVVPFAPSLRRVRPSERAWGPSRRRRWAAGVVKFAAVLLIALALGHFIAPHGLHRHRHATADLDAYLAAFETDPIRAQQALLTSYEGRPIDLEGASRPLGYPLAVDGLSSDYTLHAAYLIDMPCCQCAQVLCKRKDGSMIAIFEQRTDQPVRFGACPSVSVQCGGRACTVIRGGSQLAASWTRSGRRITVIGVRDLNEVGALMARLRPAASS